MKSWNNSAWKEPFSSTGPLKRLLLQSHGSIYSPDPKFLIFLREIRLPGTHHFEQKFVFPREKTNSFKHVLSLCTCVSEKYRLVCFLFSSLVDYGLQLYRKEDSSEGYQQHLIQIYTAPEIHSLLDFEPNSMTDVYR